MKHFNPKRLVLVAILFLFPAMLWAENKVIEKMVSIDINGKTHKISLDTDSKISIDDKIYDIKISQDDISKFHGYGVQFLFPSNMAANLDNSSPNVDMWSIDGDDEVIMVHGYGITVEFKEIVNQMIGEYKKMKADVVKKTDLFEGQHGKLEGVKISVKLGNIRLVQKIYLISGKKEKTTILILQNILDGKNSTKTFLKLERMIKQSLKITKK